MFCWITIPHRTASTGLSKMAIKPSPVVLTSFHGALQCWLYEFALDTLDATVRALLIDLH